VNYAYNSKLQSVTPDSEKPRGNNTREGAENNTECSSNGAGAGRNVENDLVHTTLQRIRRLGKKGKKEENQGTLGTWGGFALLEGYV